MEWINIIVQGVLIGGLYALFAAGLSLIFGVMRLVNIAHGDLIIAAAYLLTAVVLAGLIVWVLADGRAQRRRLAELEARGIRRTSAQKENAP